MKEVIETVKATTDKMTKAELIEQLCVYEEILILLEDKFAKKAKLKKVGRKDQVLAILKANKRVSIKDIAEQVGITSQNVSSQLCYLKADGLEILTDSKGRKMLSIEEG